MHFSIGRRAAVVLSSCFLLTAGAGLGTAVTASAAPGPCSTSAPSNVDPGAPNGGSSTTAGGDCTISGQVVVSSTLALEVGVSSFSLTNSLNSATYPVCIADNNAGSPGYYVDTQITGAFKGTAVSTNMLTAPDLITSTVLSETVGNSNSEHEQNVVFTANSPNTGLSTIIPLVQETGLSTGTNYSGGTGDVGGTLPDCTAIGGNPTDTYSLSGFTEISSGPLKLTTGVVAPGDTYNGTVTDSLWG